MTNLCDWFNPHSIDHLRAFYHLNKVGCWPQWFIDLMKEDDVVIDPLWGVQIIAKLADAWVMEKLNNL
jgi:hypothetical protein